LENQLIMAALSSRCGHFCPVVSSSFYLLFSSPTLSRRRLDVWNVYHTATHGEALVRI